MKWNYFACSFCHKAFRTTTDNPDRFVKCANCGRQSFLPISKGEYDQERRVHVTK